MMIVEQRTYDIVTGKLGQYMDGTSVAGGGSEQYLWFRVRAPKGEAWFQVESLQLVKVK